MANGDATGGASIAASGTKNNRLSETQYEAYKKELEEAGNNPAKIKEVLATFTDIDKANEELLASKLQDQEFYDGLVRALKENPDLTEYQGVIISGKSIQPQYSDFLEMGISFDREGNIILTDTKIAFDKRNEDVRNRIGSAVLSSGLGMAAQAGVVGAEFLKDALSAYQYIKMIVEKTIEVHQKKVEHASILDTGLSIAETGSSAGAGFFIGLVNSVNRKSIDEYDTSVPRPKK